MVVVDHDRTLIEVARAAGVLQQPHQYAPRERLDPAANTGLTWSIPTRNPGRYARQPPTDSEEHAAIASLREAILDEPW